MDRNKASRSALIIIIFTLGSKLLGFFREVLIASKFGSGINTDTFFIALTATGLVTAFLSGSISTTFIPVLCEIELKEGKKGKVEHTNNMITILIIISIVLVIVGWWISPFIVKLLAKGFKGDQFSLAVQLTRIGLPMILFGGIMGIFTAYLQSEQKFAGSAAIGFPFNIVYIVFLLFLSSRFGIKGLMVTAVIAVASQILVQIPEIRDSGYKYKFKFDLKDKVVTKVILLSLPVLIGVAINDINAIVDRTLASSLVSGSISALTYAERLNSLVLGVFISAITTVIFPLLSKESNNNNILGMKKILSYGINLILVITVPASIGLIVLATPIVDIAFQRGAFDEIASTMTSQALRFYSLGLIAMALNLLLTRAYYSLQDTKTPMINAGISVIFNIIFNLVLIQNMGHLGLALATSMATTLATCLLLYGLRKKIGPLNSKKHVIIFLKTLISSLVMGVVTYFIYYELSSLLGISTLDSLISLLISVVLGIMVYIVLCYTLDIEEIKNILDKIKVRLIKK